jgi:hypothetical protein
MAQPLFKEMGPRADLVAFVVTLNRLERDVAQRHNADVAAAQKAGVWVF